MVQSRKGRMKKMKKTLAVICSLSLIFSLVACSSEANGSEPSSSITPSNSSSTATQESANLREISAERQIYIQTNDKTLGDTTTAITSKPTLLPVSETISPPAMELETETDNSIYRIQIVVGDQNFPTVLYKNETTDAIMDRLPMTLDMSDMNGNEKYYYFSDSLATDSEKPSEIHAGDLMLYGTDCLVLFYESFSSSYSYTTLGYVEDAVGLASVLGSGNIQVSFNAK